MLHKAVFFLASLFVFSSFCAGAGKLDFRVITSVRHGLETSLDYIDGNLHKVNVDGLLGVAFVRAFMKTSYKNESHIMDNTTKKLLNRTIQIIKRGRNRFKNNSNNNRNGNNWKFAYLVDKDIWTKTINYKNYHLLAPLRKPNTNIIPGNTLKSHNSDKCLQEIVNSTRNREEPFQPCVVSMDCWNDFFRDATGQGYYLTHKLLLLQIAKARKCVINKKFYNNQIRDICSSILSEIVQANYYDKADRIFDLFDLFLEQVLLCGYEGFTEFIENSWLFYILKSQRLTGCFRHTLTDSLKSRIKKDMTYFEDGCNDHSTGLGAAVLGLYYNYIVNEELVEYQ